MFTTSLRKVCGSVMLAVPPAILDLLNLQAGARRIVPGLTFPLLDTSHCEARRYLSRFTRSHAGP